MKEICTYCGAPVTRGVDGHYVHDATLGELRVTTAELEDVHIATAEQKRAGGERRRYAALHSPFPAESAPW